MRDRGTSVTRLLLVAVPRAVTAVTASVACPLARGTYNRRMVTLTRPRASARARTTVPYNMAARTTRRTTRRATHPLTPLWHAVALVPAVDDGPGAPVAPTRMYATTVRYEAAGAVSLTVIEIRARGCIFVVTVTTLLRVTSPPGTRTPTAKEALRGLVGVGWGAVVATG